MYFPIYPSFTISKSGGGVYILWTCYSDGQLPASLGIVVLGPKAFNVNLQKQKLSD